MEPQRGGVVEKNPFGDFPFIFPERKKCVGVFPGVNWARVVPEGDFKNETVEATNTRRGSFPDGLRQGAGKAH